MKTGRAIRRTFNPKTIKNLVYWGVPDNTGISGSITYQTDPTTNGNFEGAAGPAGWSNWQATISRQSGTRPGGAGSYVGQVLYDGSDTNGALTQTELATGNSYLIQGWAYSDGYSTPRIWTGGITAWTGTATLGWQQFSFTVASGGTSLWLGAITLSSGKLVQYDDVTVTPLYCAQLTDLSGNTNHLLQATAANQPLWVAGGTGGLLRFAHASNQYIKATFTYPQPEHIFIAATWTGADSTYLVDGNTTNSMALYCSGTTTLACYSTAAGYNVLSYIDGSAHVYEFIANGGSSNSALARDGGALNAGSVGTTAAGGITVGTVGGGTSTYAVTADIYGVIAYNRVLSQTERIRVVKYLAGRASKAGVQIF